MRRTYRSKKDTGGVLDRRDLLLNLDEKSSAYNAFFIQNIKQTKRELSCVGSSNAYGVASNRVRKKKYVKRIVKEPESPCRESCSRSAYLTPDKSIRVNKPMDPFDMLLNSSPACQVEVPQAKAESVTSKVNVFEKNVQKKEGKTYTRRKPAKTKKPHYSSSESDSDKENSDEQGNVTQNTSDIKAYQLLIEHELKTTPKRFNDSINNVVNNLSLFNKLKHKNSFNESMKRPLSYYKNRLTRNIQSPILQKSPLCSTPFKAKYRGESIYKFSPITLTNNDSPKYTTISEDNDISYNSIVFLGSNNAQSPGNSKETVNTPFRDDIPNDFMKCNAASDVMNVEMVKNLEGKIFCNGSKDDSKHLELVSKTNAISSVEVSSLQTTEAEPLFGFSNNDNTEILSEDKGIQRISHLDDTPLKNNMTEIEVSENSNNAEEINQSDGNTGKEDSNTSTSESVDDDKDSLYNTCTSEQSSIEEKEVTKEAIVQIQRMNDSSFLRYYEKMNNFSSDSNETTESVEEKNNGNLDDSENEVFSQGEEFASFEDSNVSNEQIFENDTDIEENGSDIDNASYIEDDVSDIVGNGSNTDGNDSYIDENVSDIKETESDVEENGTKEEKVGEYLLQNETGDYVDIVSSNDDDGDSNEEDKCISFVTTRRRNEVTNNSMMSIFNDSYASSSTDCDKTVLSNFRGAEKSEVIEKKHDIIDENDTLMDLNTDEHISYGEEIVKLHSEISPTRLTYCQDNDNTRISFVTTRNSNITDRKSSIRCRKSSIKPRDNIISTRKSSKLPEESIRHSPEPSRKTCFEKPSIVLQPGKKWERSLSIYRRITMMTDHFDQSILEEEPFEKKGRKYRQSVISTMEMQELNGSLHNESINSRRSTFVSKPSRSTIRIVKDPDISGLSLSNTTVFDDLKGFLNEECDDTIIELSKLSIADQPHEVTVLNTFHDTSSRIATARDYVLRRCSQADAILFDECYPDTVLKNCHKIGEGVYGEVFLWRARDGRARVLKIVPIAGTLKVNGESQKDFHEIISEIVIAMELSALRAPIAEINRHFDEGKDVEALDLHAIENATDIFNEVLAVRCVYGSYPARLLDLWDLYDECKGSENDNPAILPPDQQFIVLELANAGQDLESYQFNNAEQAYALFLQVAYGLAVAEEAFQFEHRDLHWGNVLIAPTEQKYSTFVLRGRSHRVARCGVAATIIDYSLSRVSLPLAGGECAALYNDLATDDSLFDAVGDYQFEVYRLMRDKLGNDWKSFAPYTNILWLHYTVDKMITALRYKRTNTKIHKHYIEKLKGIKSRILDYGSAALFVLTDNEI